MVQASSEMDDAALVRASLSGDEEALPVLVARHLAPVFRYVARMLGDRDAAADVVQDVFVKAWKALGSYDPRRSFKAWLFTIAKRTAIDALRKREPIAFSRLERLDDEGFERAADFGETIPDGRPLADERLLGEERLAALYSAIDALPPKARSAVLLHEVEGLTFVEIAEALEESLNTTKSRYRRACLLLRRRLGPSREAGIL